MRVVFVTSNEAKVREAGEILGVRVEQVSLDLPEIQALDVEEVAVAKAESAYRALGEPAHPVLVEDSGLAINAWRGLPGALTKWFMMTVGNEGLCRMLDAGADRSAKAVAVVAIADAGSVRVFRGEVQGEVSHEPKGTGGFGWDPIFIPSGEARTYAEMGSDKHLGSHRAQAFKAASQWLAAV